MKNKLPLPCFALAAGLFIALPAQAAVLYQDDFNFGTPSTPAALDGRTPTVTTGTNTWRAGSTWAADGSTVTPNAASSANLPFVPQSGMIYELSATMRNSVVGTGWISLGFSSNSEPDTTANFVTGAQGRGTVILRGDNRVRWWEIRNDGTAAGSGEVNITDSSVFNSFRLVLDTTQAAWTMDLFLNNTAIDLNPGDINSTTHTWSTNPTIGAVLLTSSSNISGRDYGEISLTAVPEPTAVLLAAAASLALLGRRRRL